MFNFRPMPCLSIITVGSLDWLTTVIGITYFGAVEGNPLMAQLISNNLFLYSIIKLLTTLIIGFIFYKAEKLLSNIQDKNNRFFKLTRAGVRITYTFATIILVVAILNNIFIVIQKI
ncbi:MAG: hypothetical protein AC479_01060 [miscellaneous Crenarchaeota group-6 archaeon AD8-1]|nr:MAG: hypothetical protein AC479_01060 [miscellaneous Crenarchaeota group-6 archaeon AD8-1]